MEKLSRPDHIDENRWKRMTYRERTAEVTLMLAAEMVGKVPVSQIEEFIEGEVGDFKVDTTPYSDLTDMLM